MKDEEQHAATAPAAQTKPAGIYQTGRLGHPAGDAGEPAADGDAPDTDQPGERTDGEHDHAHDPQHERITPASAQGG